MCVSLSPPPPLSLSYMHARTHARTHVCVCLITHMQVALLVVVITIILVVIFFAQRRNNNTNQGGQGVTDVDNTAGDNVDVYISRTPKQEDKTGKQTNPNLDAYSNAIEMKDLSSTNS